MTETVGQSTQLPDETTKKDGTVPYCKNEDCDYKMAVSDTDVTSDAAADSKVPAA